MAAAAHGHVAADLTGEAHSRSHVGRRSGLGDDPGTSVYVAVPHARRADRVVIGVVGRHHAACEAATERIESVFGRLSH